MPKHKPSLTQRVKWPLVGAIISAVAGALGFLAVNGDTLVRNAKSVADWWRGDQILTGTWSNNNEGSVLEADRSEVMDNPDRLVWLSITSESGLIAGVIHSPILCKFVPWPYVQFLGENGLIRTTGEAFDAVDGKEVIFGKYRLSVSGDVLTLVGQGIFGTHRKLFRISSEARTELEGVPQVCPEYERKLNELNSKKLKPEGAAHP